MILSHSPRQDDADSLLSRAARLQGVECFASLMLLMHFKLLIFLMLLVVDGHVRVSDRLQSAHADQGDQIPHGRSSRPRRPDGSNNCMPLHQCNYEYHGTEVHSHTRLRDARFPITQSSANSNARPRIGARSTSPADWRAWANGLDGTKRPIRLRETQI